MSIAIDAFSSSEAGASERKWTHTPVGTPAAVLVFVIAQSTNPSVVTGVTYGGKAMAAVDGSPVTHATEPGQVVGYYLAAPPAGAQEVIVASGIGFNQRRGACFSITTSGAVGVLDTATLDSASVANPSLELNPGEGEHISLAAIHSGQDDASGLSAAAGFSDYLEHDFGSAMGSWIASAASSTAAALSIGWTATASPAGALAVSVGLPLPPRIHVREFPRLDLHYEAQAPNSRYYRWGKDEPQPENIPYGGGFSTSIPGGHDTLRVNLPRKPQVEYSDLARLTTIRALGAGGDVASEVRLQEAPRTSGDEYSIGPEAVGWRAHLEDDTTATEIYRDADLNSWTGPGRAEENALEAGNFPPIGASEVLADPTTGIPSLRLSVDDTWTSPRKPIAEVWYDAGPSCVVARVPYEFSGNSDTGFILIWGSGAQDNSAAEFSADLFTAATGSGTATPSTARRFFQWQWYHGTTPGGLAGGKFACDLRRMVVEGNHGLTKQGTEPEAGYLASDVIADAVSRWAPLLNFSTGSSGTIRPSSFVIRHLVFKENVTAQAIVGGANRYELRPYAVWEGPDPRKIEPTFYYHDWGERGRVWRGRVAPTQLAETGPSVERLRNGVIIEYQDVDGTTKMAGPVGSGCDVEDTSLEDKDPENPANQRGLKMYGPPISMEGVSVSSEAIRVGALVLERLKEADSSGQAQLVGTCEDDRGVRHPAWRARAGDYFEPIDAADKRPRRIIRSDYDETSLTNTITLDAPPDEPEDLFAQLGVSIADLGL